MTGVTSRTLRHYDAEGVVVPVGVGSGGVRLYGRAELLRLQQVLVLRELGLSLPAVRAVVDGTTDRAAALRDHRERLLVERDRLDRLAATVARTIEELEGGEEMTEDQLFEGFDPERQKAYERELVEDWGVSEEEIDRSKGAVSALGPEGIAANEAQRVEIETALVSLMETGAAPDDDRVLDLLVGHWELTRSLLGPGAVRGGVRGPGDDVCRAPGVKGALRRDGTWFRRVDQRRAHGLRPGPPPLTRFLPQWGSSSCIEHG